MGKTAIVTPVYLSFAWVLMMSYQLFTETAVRTVLSEVNVLWPSLGSWLIPRTDILVFIYAFSWMFLLSSAIPSFLLGEGKGAFLQFMFVFTLTVSVSFIEMLLVSFTGFNVERLFSFIVYLNNPLDAATYLMIPYIIMLGIDIVNKRA